MLFRCYMTPTTLFYPRPKFTTINKTVERVFMPLTCRHEWCHVSFKKPCETHIGKAKRGGRKNFNWSKFLKKYLEFEWFMSKRFAPNLCKKRSDGNEIITPKFIHFWNFNFVISRLRTVSRIRKCCLGDNLILCVSGFVFSIANWL